MGVSDAEFARLLEEEEQRHASPYQKRFGKPEPFIVWGVDQDELWTWADHRCPEVVEGASRGSLPVAVNL
jgi:hypothetical protein